MPKLAIKPPQKKPLSTRLQPQSLEIIRTLADQHGVGISTFASFLMERAVENYDILLSQQKTA